VTARLAASAAAFSLLEVLVATTLTLVTAAAAFQLFHQNARIFTDQSVILEMQQSARVVASQLADDIRMAGQGLPPSINETVLPGSGVSRLNIRIGFNATESVVLSPLPMDVAVANPLTLAVETTSGFSSGRQVFLWTDSLWARALINSVSGSSKTIRITPSAISKTPLQIKTLPVLSVDEAVAIYHDSATNTVRRTTATSTENPFTPNWAPANDLASNVRALTFLYFDGLNTPLTPDTPIRRSQIRTIEARVSVRSSSALSDGSRPVYSMSVRGAPRNSRVP